MSKPKPIEEIASDYVDQIWETTRKTLAMRKRYQGAFVRFRRAAKEGPNADFAVVIIVYPGNPTPVSEIISYAMIELLAEEVTDAEVAEWLTRYTEESPE